MSKLFLSRVLHELRPKSAFATFVVCLAVLGCSAPKTVVKEDPYPALPSSALDARYFHSPVGDVAGHYPAGWLLVNLENLPDFSNVLFVYTDPARTDALVLSEIPGTAELRRSVERDGLVAIAQQSFLLKSQKTAGKTKMTGEPQLFTEKNKIFASYEYTSVDSGGGPALINRAVVFTTGVRFYELAMIELLPSGESLEVRKSENFRLLQSVIGELEGAAELKQIVTKPGEAAQ